MLQAETQFRKVVGYTDLAKLAVAVERDLATDARPFTPQPRRHSRPSACNHHTDRRHELPRRTGQPRVACEYGYSPRDVLGQDFFLRHFKGLKLKERWEPVVHARKENESALLTRLESEAAQRGIVAPTSTLLA